MAAHSASFKASRYPGQLLPSVYSISLAAWHPSIVRYQRPETLGMAVDFARYAPHAGL